MTLPILAGAHRPPKCLPWLLACAAVLAACSPSAQPPEGAGAPGASGPPPAMPVGVKVVQAQTVPVLIEAVGQAEGSKEVEVRTRVTGVLQKQLYTEGDRVRAGTPLFLIDRAPFEIALEQARAALAQADAQLEKARREAARLPPLIAAQAIAQRDLDDAVSAQRLAEAQRAAAVAVVREAELNLSYTRIVSPITGLTARAERSEGSLVTPGDNGLLTRVRQTDPIWVRFSFSPSELAALRSGKAGAVRLLDDAGATVGPVGRLNYAGSSVDERLGTVQLRAEFPNPSLAVLPGQFVKAQLQAGEQRAHLVPQAAVLTSEQGKAVWTIQDGKATPTPVELGGWVGNDWVVRKGLKDGDQVIVDNLIKLRPGAPVSAQSTAAAPAGPGAASGAIRTDAASAAATSASR